MEDLLEEPVSGDLAHLILHFLTLCLTQFLISHTSSIAFLIPFTSLSTFIIIVYHRQY